MILFDVLEMFDENKKLNVWDCGEPDNLLTFYDGRNSIDMIYNYCEVTGLSTHFDEYDNETVLDVYIKQDPQNICRGDIIDFLSMEFDSSIDEAREELTHNIVGLAVSYHDNQASYDLNSQTLILECGEIVRYIPVKYQDINSYLDFGLLVAMIDDLQAILD
jgi:hypothetical protein